MDEFDIDDALYAHAKFSKVGKRDILYTRVNDVFDQNKIEDVYRKGRLIARFVGF